MMYHEWISPGKYPRIQSKTLIQPSAEQSPRRIHTGRGGKRTRRMMRQMSDKQPHILGLICGKDVVDVSDKGA